MGVRWLGPKWVRDQVPKLGWTMSSTNGFTGSVGKWTWAKVLTSLPDGPTGEQQQPERPEQPGPAVHL
jgi:hypothetical protein